MGCDGTDKLLYAFPDSWSWGRKSQDRYSTSFGHKNDETDRFCNLLYRLDRSTGTLQILYYLGKFGPKSKSRLRQRISLSQDAIEHSINVLISDDLIRCEQCAFFPFSKTITLSNKGQLLVNSSLIDWPSILIKKNEEEEQKGCQRVWGRRRESLDDYQTNIESSGSVYASIAGRSSAESNQKEPYILTNGWLGE